MITEEDFENELYGMTTNIDGSIDSEDRSAAAKECFELAKKMAIEFAYDLVNNIKVDPSDETVCVGAAFQGEWALDKLFELYLKGEKK